MERVLVIGGTGTLGRPLVRQLLEDGREVRLLARDADRTKQWLRGEGLTAEVVGGSVEDPEAVHRAVSGCRQVHVSLAAGPNADDLDRVEHRGTALVATSAARNSVELLSYVSGSLV
ncbi:MAG: SDR family oxidoreductase, partial [Actinomycetota bacterium]|nr:SDR family oxidoreductase [Actinomycetota bacterium]